MLQRRGEPGDREAADSLLTQALESATRYGCRSLERRVPAAIKDARPDRFLRPLPLNQLAVA